MTTKHEIEIPDLPEGWRPVAYRAARCGIDHVLRNGQVTIYNWFLGNADMLIVEKIKPRRIVFEYAGIGKPRIGDYLFDRGNLCMCSDPDNFGSDHQIWRVVEEE